jgi:hypothetical protein
MKEQHVLLDYENVQPTLEQLAKLSSGFTNVWLFHGPHQARQAQQLSATHERVTSVPRSGKGPNALDFHLSFYLGYVAARHPDAQLVVIANDQGYDPMIEHASKVLGFQVKRVGFKPGKAAEAKKPAPAKKAAAIKVSAPAKKVAAKKTAAQKAPAKKTSTKKVTAAKAVAVSAKPAPVKKVPAKKAAAKAPTPAKKVPAPHATLTLEAKAFDRIKKGLGKMGDKAPHKFKPFLRHLESMLGAASTPSVLDALVKKLELEGVVQIAGDRVLYGSSKGNE